MNGVSRSSVCGHVQSWTDQQCPASTQKVTTSITTGVAKLHISKTSNELSPSWEANRSSASQETPRILWNPNVHHHIHHIPPTVRILIQINQLHALPSHFLEIKLISIHIITCYILRSKNYMFRPVVAIIRFYHSTHLRLFYTIRVAACLMRRAQLQIPCWSIVPLYWVCGWTTW